MGNGQKPPVQKVRMRAGPKGNTKRSPLEIHVVEHVYDGSPRWRDPEGKKAHGDHTADRSSEIARDSGSRTAIMGAWGTGHGSSSPQAAFRDGIYDLITCTNPTCPQRMQIRLTAGAHHHTRTTPCTGCKKDKDVAFVHSRPLESKWLYVLRGATPKLETEIYAKSATEWLILDKPDRNRSKLPVFQGKGLDKRVYQSSARMKVLPGEPYQFFVSPVQLGKKAIATLEAQAKKDHSPKHHTQKNGYCEQLFTTTLRRTFQKPATKMSVGTPRTEMVAVIDPFVFTQEAKEWDFLPIARAMFELELNPEERAKKHIASILTALIGELKDDKFDLADEIDKNAGALRSKHHAQAWLDKYKECLELLSAELGKAAERLVDWADSPAHWVVEEAILERKDEPDILALGMVQYNTLLKEIMVSPVGKMFAVRLATKHSDRLPAKFIWNPQATEKNAIQKLRGQYGDLAVQLSAMLMPVLIAKEGSAKAADAYVAQLKDLGAEALVQGKIDPGNPFGFKHIILVKSTLLAIDDARIEKNLKGLFPTRARDKILPALKLFTEFETHLEGAFALLTAMKVYSEKSSSSDSAMDKFVRAKSQVEYPFQVAKFVTDMRKFQLSMWAKKNFGADISKLPKGPLSASSAGITRNLSNATMLKELEKRAVLYVQVTKIARVFTGPVGLIFGGMDFVVHAKSTITNWENGNLGGSAGALFLTSAAMIGVTAALIETGALLGMITGAKAAAMLGPLGILAAVLMIGGTLLYALFNKSDLELFASHCFLGNEYGKGSSGQGPKWASGIAYPKWRAQSAAKQQEFLLNLIGSTRVLHRHWPVMTAPGIEYGCWVKTGWLPPGARVEVQITGDYAIKQAGGENPVEKQLTATAWVDLSTGEMVVKGHDTHDVKATLRAYPDKSWGTKKFASFSVALDYRGGDVVLPKQVKRGRESNRYRCQVKVRVDVDGADHFMPNGFGGTKYIELDSAKALMLGEIQGKWP